ncbi:chemotaxis protein CheB [Rhodanobacter sp. UC4437_H4]
MTDTPPAVALLFDDSELGGHLRDALHERGARIVHEGGLAGLNRELLQQVGADVLVINLDDDADDALDQLYDIIDGDRPRVVFNDAQASRALSGWDRARWARHLAVKVLAMGDIDPPRPEDAREVQVAPALVAAVAPVVTETLGRDAVDEPATFATPAEDDLAAPIAQDAATPVMADEPPPDLPADEPLQTAANEDDAPGAAFDAHAGIPFDDEIEPAADPGITAESDDLAAELEALLASGELPDEEDEQTVGAGLRFTGDEELPPLHDGDFGVVELADSDDDRIALDESAPSPAVDELDFSALDAPDLTAEAMDAAASVVPAAPETPVRAPDNWALLDEEAPVESNDKPDAAAFGIEKLSAAEFLAPDVEPVAADLQPTMSLELVSMEEAIAPQAFVPDHEMVLDELGSALSRIVLLGAAVDGVDSVCEFMRSLPASTRLTFLLTQHLGSHTEQEMLARLAEKSPLPVRVAEAGRRVGMGEVLMVPAGQQVRLRRDGSVELLADAAPEPSIDASLSMAANGFGRDAVAIVFAGRGNDAIAGSQAIHDRGGQVWVESSSGDHFADMVSGIFAERLVSFSGTPSELAAHLIEVFP